jgi:hypothetical protein
MLAPFEIIADRVQPTAGPGSLVFERVLTLLDADPHCPLNHTVDYALAPDEAGRELQGVIVISIQDMEGGYGGRLKLRGRIMDKSAYQPPERPAGPAPRYRVKTESPDLWVLCGVRWQFFGSLTFKQEKLPDRIRRSMFHAILRQLAKNQHIYFPRLAWCRREELGELLGRRHYHFLLTGLATRSVNISTCFFLMHAWEKMGGGWARVRLYDQSQDGLEYITKCLSGADAYETSKFAEGLSALTLSEGLQRLLQAHPVMGARRLAQR